MAFCRTNALARLCTHAHAHYRANAFGCFGTFVVPLRMDVVFLTPYGATFGCTALPAARLGANSFGRSLPDYILRCTHTTIYWPHRFPPPPHRAHTRLYLAFRCALHSRLLFIDYYIPACLICGGRRKAGHLSMPAASLLYTPSASRYRTAAAPRVHGGSSVWRGSGTARGNGSAHAAWRNGRVHGDSAAAPVLYRATTRFRYVRMRRGTAALAKKAPLISTQQRALRRRSCFSFASGTCWRHRRSFRVAMDPPPQRIPPTTLH